MFLPKIWIICRVCLQQQEEMYNIFEDKVVTNISSLLRDCGGVAVRKNDNMPDKICEACLRRLCKANNFRMDCQRGHRELVQILIERSINLYELDLEEEKRNCSDVITISDSNTNYRVSSFISNLYVPITTELSENAENIVITETNEENDMENPAKSYDYIKQYHVVPKRNTKEKEIMETTTKPIEKEPIILLLKLKNTSPKQSSTKRKVKDPDTKISRKAKENTEAPDKIESNIENEKEKLGSETLINEKLKTKSNITNRSKKGTVKYTCRICKKKCGTYVLLRHHMYTHNRPHQCKICKKSFSQIQTFLCHNNLHTGIKPYYCRFCYRSFSDITNRNCHERTLHKNQEYKCEKCNKIFRFITLLEKHAQSHRQKKCYICNKEFASLQMVRKHHQGQHLKLTNYNKN
ncbi:zinc finger protein 627-like isoform X1 [Lucilia cuprina]|uniref:zinc finger protein 627-like isoform X1 n=1 Tax=Lucilia cuprina TaxID=7375 RepID=UPI001F06A252|nr:zinc finger protein 627-like isoform X1 [Lucilia cuprina]